MVWLSKHKMERKVLLQLLLMKNRITVWVLESQMMEVVSFHFSRVCLVNQKTKINLKSHKEVEYHNKQKPQAHKVLPLRHRIKKVLIY